MSWCQSKDKDRRGRSEGRLLGPASAWTVPETKRLKRPSPAPGLAFPSGSEGPMAAFHYPYPLPLSLASLVGSFIPGKEVAPCPWSSSSNSTFGERTAQYRLSPAKVSKKREIRICSKSQKPHHDHSWQINVFKISETNKCWCVVCSPR